MEEFLELNEVINKRSFYRRIKNGSINIFNLIDVQIIKLTDELKRKTEKEQMGFLMTLMDNNDDDKLRKLSNLFKHFHPILKKISNLPYKESDRILNEYTNS